MDSLLKIYKSVNIHLYLYSTFNNIDVSQQLYSDNRRLQYQRLFRLYSRSRIKLLSR